MTDIGAEWQEKTGHKTIRQLIEPTVRRDMGEIELPESAGLGSSIYSALKHRRSNRSYSVEPIPLAEIATLCWVAYGANEKVGELDLFTTPSAGATFPLNLYVIAQNVIDLEPGLYRYEPNQHLLKLLALREMAEVTAIAMLEQAFIARAGCTLVWSADIDKSQDRYGERAYRYVYLEAGHQCQNTLLTAYSLDLSACPIGAFFDKEVKNLLGIDDDIELPLYAATFGNPA